ncbi:MAG TPA: VOC family protein [Streptosporangiaceae bacterium]|nr:VOC family protein [Streptosporangiaceae bacterium]
MSERDGYQPGVPCWISSRHSDAEAAARFYARLFGWKAEKITPAGMPGSLFICKLRGRDVAAIGPPQGAGAPVVPAWETCIWADSAQETVQKAAQAGGRALAGPLASFDGGRAAVLADPAGAVFGVWQPGTHRGAQLVNEPGAWSWSALNTHNVEASKAFYAAIFGWQTGTFGTGDGQVTLWRVPGYVGGEPKQPVARDVVAGMVPAPAQVAPHWSVDFWVDNVDATADTALKLGGTVISAPASTQAGRTAVLADPQGAQFSVSKVAGAAD